MKSITLAQLMLFITDSSYIKTNTVRAKTNVAPTRHQRAAVKLKNTGNKLMMRMICWACDWTRAS